MLFYKLRNFPKQRNVFIPILLGITLSKLIHSYGSLYDFRSFEISAKEVSVGLVRLIVLLIAGRVMPFFTRKKMGIEINLPTWINPLALVPIILLVFPWPDSTPNIIMGTILLIAIIGGVTRQLLWKPLKTVKVPILFILHVGVAFINAGLVLEFFALFYNHLNFSQAPLHLLMAGGLGVVSIGIMTRVTLGHTGRIIEADKWTVFAYLLIIIGSIIRICVPIFHPEFYLKSLYVAGGLWSFGFFVFFLRYFNTLIKPRPDGKAY